MKPKIELSYINKRESGVAVLFVIIGLAVLSLIGLLMAFNASTEYQMSNNYVTYAQALQVADAGLGTIKETLRGQDLSVVLSSTKTVPFYTSEAAPQVGSYAYRNPMTRQEARNVNFAKLPTAYGSRTQTGYASDIGGTPYGPGRFFIKITDNDDSGLAGGPVGGILSQLGFDEDFRVYVRVFGVVPNAPAEFADARNNTIKNSFAVIEALIQRDVTFDLKAPFALYGPDVDPSKAGKFFDGNSFTVDGYNHNGMTTAEILGGHAEPVGDPAPGIATFFDNATGGDGLVSATTVKNGLSGPQQDNVTGDNGLYGPTPSIDDITNDLRTSEVPGASNIFDPAWMANFMASVGNFADVKYSGVTKLSGGGISLGTESNPKITYVNGDLEVSGGGSGAGILIVTGKFIYSGAFDFNGVVAVVGTGDIEFSGANKSLIGGLLVANLFKDGTGKWTYGDPKFTLGGNTNFYYKSDAIRLGLNLLPMQTLSWREITAESDPAP